MWKHPSSTYLRGFLLTLLAGTSLAGACSICRTANPTEHEAPNLKSGQSYREANLTPGEVQQVLSELPRFGKNKEYVIYEGDILLSAEELPSYIKSIAETRRSAFRAVTQWSTISPNSGPFNDEDCVIYRNKYFCRDEESALAGVSAADLLINKLKLSMKYTQSTPDSIEKEIEQIKKEYGKGTVDFLPAECQFGTWLYKPLGEPTSVDRTRHITYSVDFNSFWGRYSEFVRYMEKASAEWNDLCGKDCLIDFVHDKSHDKDAKLAPGADLVFVVKYEDAIPEYPSLLALSFYPRQADDAKRRYLRIFPAFFSSVNKRVGILKHELGHILGLRHEHLRSQTACLYESKPENAKEPSWLPVAEYDPKSIMHYSCDSKLFERENFSDGDKKLIMSLYTDKKLGKVIKVDYDEIRRRLQAEATDNFRNIWAKCKNEIDKANHL